MGKNKFVGVALLFLLVAGGSYFIANSVKKNKGTTPVTSSSSSSQTSESSSVNKTRGTLGSETKEEGEYTLLIKNQTGEKITSFVIKGMIGDSESPDYLKDQPVFANEEERVLYFQPKQITTETGEAADSESDLLVNFGYNVSIKFQGDDEPKVLHGMPFEEAQMVNLQYKEGILYATYENSATGENIDTFEYEKNQKEIEEDFQ